MGVRNDNPVCTTSIKGDKMTTETPTRIEICCDKSCPNYQVEQIIALTTDEIIAMGIAAEQAIAKREEEDAAAEALAALKASAKAKLIAGQKLTEEEAATIVL